VKEYWAWLALLGIWVFPCGAELSTRALSGPGDFASAVLEEIQLRSDGLLTLAPLAETKNLALGQKVVDDYGKAVPLSDGSVASGGSEWISATPNVFGRTFTVDLGLDRAINRVRILPGGTAEFQPEYFIRGYRLEASTQLRPEVWHRLAEERSNFKLTVDTSRDSTWSKVDELGKPVPLLGRYVKLTLIRQDRSNWVSLGDIEVYGAGYESQGQLAGELGFSRQVNVGRLRWQAETPAGTQVHVLARGGDQAEFGQESSSSLYSGPEPLEGFEYRLVLKTRDPLVSPAFSRLEVDWDSLLVARKALGSVQPDTVRKGEESAVVYRVELEMGPEDYGVDLLQLGAAVAVEAIRWQGIALDHTWRRDEEQGFTQLSLDRPLRDSGVLEIAGRALFLEDQTAIPVSVGSRAQEAQDGYLNWQNATQAPGATWTVRGVGLPPDLLSGIEIAPRPFSPFRDQQVEFSFVVGNLRQETEISLEVFSLAGVSIRRLSQVGGARAYRLRWDGRDQGGRVAAPGLYLYEIRVDAEDNAASRTGTVVVAY
jgi:hypothetical protein